jgi:uncharacterized protein YggE
MLALAALVSACSGAAFAQSATPTAEPPPTQVTRTLSVTGSGIAYLTPDIAYVTIGVHTENKNAAEAVAANNSAAEEVMSALRELGIDAKDIQTTNFSIYPQQQYDSEGKPTGEITYIVDNSVRVTVRDLGQIGDVLDASVQAGANSISGIQFDVQDKTAALSEARQAAMQAAETKAQELAEAAGVTLGDVQTISEFSGYPTPLTVEKTMVMAEAAQSVPVSTGQMTVSVDVNVVYEIR